MTTSFFPRSTCMIINIQHHHNSLQKQQKQLNKTTTSTMAKNPIFAVIWIALLFFLAWPIAGACAGVRSSLNIVLSHRSDRCAHHWCISFNSNRGIDCFPQRLIHPITPWFSLSFYLFGSIIDYFIINIFCLPLSIPAHYSRSGCSSR